MTDTECQPDNSEARQHTPTPWHADDTAIFATDGVLARIPNHPDNGKNWKEDAAFIVEAVNNYAALTSRGKADGGSERSEVRSEALADQIHDACPHKIDEPPNCALVKSRLECVCEHVHMHAIRAARSGSPVLSALVDLHAVARVDRDEDYAAITNAAAVIEAAGSGCAAQTSFSPGEPVEIRKVEDEIDEIVIRCGDVHIEQMDASSWFLGVNASDGTYHQFWFGAKNRKSHVNFRHTESSPAASPSVPSADREGK